MCMMHHVLKINMWTICHNCKTQLWIHHVLKNLIWKIRHNKRNIEQKKRLCPP